MNIQNDSAPPPAQKSLVMGITLVLIGSASYGLLSTFVKLAYRDGFTTAEVTTSQFVWGAVVLTILSVFVPRTSAVGTRADKFKLMMAGTTTGFTSVFYYISVNYIAASAAVVLLMQSIWMGVLFECVMNKRRPTFAKLVAVILVLLGTVLATNVWNVSALHLDVRGTVFGFLSAISYTGTLAATGAVAAHLNAIKRSQYMLYGGALVALVFALLTQIGPQYFDLNVMAEDFVRHQPFDLRVFGTYGLLVAIFGTILPPILMNKGFPITGVGLGSIISSVELPFATLVAFVLLGERIHALQLLGIAVILGSVLILNYRLTGRAR